MIYILFALFILLTTFVVLKDKLFIDIILYDKISMIISEQLTDKVIWITNLADSIICILVIIVVILILFKNKKYKDLKYFSIIIIFGNLLVTLIKLIISRERPDILQLVQESTYSFPSGHTFNASLLYGMILIIINKYFKTKRTLLILIYIFLVSLIGFSRIYLGVHYFSDVLGSIFLSIILLIIFYKIIGSEVNERKMVKRNKHITK